MRVVLHALGRARRWAWHHRVAVIAGTLVAASGAILLPGPLPPGWTFGLDASVRASLASGLLTGLIVGAALFLAEGSRQRAERRRRSVERARLLNDVHDLARRRLLTLATELPSLQIKVLMSLHDALRACPDMVLTWRPISDDMPADEREVLLRYGWGFDQVESFTHHLGTIQNAERVRAAIVDGDEYRLAKLFAYLHHAAEIVRNWEEIGRPCDADGIVASTLHATRSRLRHLVEAVRADLTRTADRLAQLGDPARADQLLSFRDEMQQPSEPSAGWDEIETLVRNVAMQVTNCPTEVLSASYILGETPADIISAGSDDFFDAIGVRLPPRRQ